jgi:hypothetical protein
LQLSAIGKGSTVFNLYENEQIQTLNQLAHRSMPLDTAKFKSWNLT